MTRDEFKKRWESNESGGGITFDDIADAAIAWGISSSPKAMPIFKVRYLVLAAAGTNDAEEYKEDIGGEE